MTVAALSASALSRKLPDHFTSVELALWFGGIENIWKPSDTPASLEISLKATEKRKKEKILPLFFFEILCGRAKPVRGLKKFFGSTLCDDNLTLSLLYRGRFARKSSETTQSFQVYWDNTQTKASGVIDVSKDPTICVSLAQQLARALSSRILGGCSASQMIQTLAAAPWAKDAYHLLLPENRG